LLPSARGTRDAVTESMPGPNDRYRIVVALDLSQYAEIVLEHAIDQAARHDAPDLHFVTVQERRDEPIDDLKTALGGLVYEGLSLFGTDAPEWRARLHVRTGRPEEEIADLAAEIGADLVIVGRFGQHRSRHRLGSIAQRVVESSLCPVLVVGLSEHAPAPANVCAGCAAVREASDGERWFCDAHAAPDRAGLATTFIPMVTSFTGGGPMW
jgi:nucleotide-binding universal stress UspA family protein